MNREGGPMNREGGPMNREGGPAHPPIADKIDEKSFRGAVSARLAGHATPGSPGPGAEVTWPGVESAGTRAESAGTGPEVAWTGAESARNPRPCVR
jgi:hypothetical protein